MGQWFQDLFVCVHFEGTVILFPIWDAFLGAQVVVDAAYKSFTESRGGIPFSPRGRGFFESRPLWFP